MVSKFAVPKFITIEDKLMGLITFRQLFALLGAFLLSFFIFKINQILGALIAIISFGLAILFTFVYINGKPFIFVLPNVIDFLFRSRRFVWQKIEKIRYQEVEVPEVTEEEIPIPKFKKRERKIIGNQIPLEITYKEVPSVREKLIISLDAPISAQAENIAKIFHRHLINPKNPYRLFPYIKFYRTIE